MPDSKKRALGEARVIVTYEEETSEVGVFDFDSKTILLSRSYTMPILGLGTYALDRREKHDWY